MKYTHNTSHLMKKISIPYVNYANLLLISKTPIPLT